MISRKYKFHVPGAAQGEGPEGQAPPPPLKKIK